MRYMTNNEAIFFWIAVWIFGVSFLAFLHGFVFNRGGSVRLGSYTAVIGFIFQTVSMGLRWAATGHPPVMSTYENSALGGWFILIIFGFLRHWHRKIEVIGVAVLPVIILLLGRGVMANPVIEPLAPPFKSNWLWLHVFFAWVAYGSFCVGAGLGFLYLLKERRVLAGSIGESIYDRLPWINVINDLIIKIIIFGFIALTVEIGAGAIWAYGLWGRYWGWDPIETWSLITWLTYGTYIHLGVTLGWKGRRMAWLAILALLSEFVTFGGIGYLGGIHTTIL